jgi:hypothetical protein
MKGLTWEAFGASAEATICRDCQCGFARPWRGGLACQHAWLRFRATRGLILNCNESRAARPARRLEERLMHTPVTQTSIGED